MTVDGGMPKCRDHFMCLIYVCCVTCEIDEGVVGWAEKYMSTVIYEKKQRYVLREGVTSDMRCTSKEKMGGVPPAP